MDELSSLKVWMNGQFVDYDKATIHARSHTLHYGTGVFEGIRAYKTPQGTVVFRLREHIKRLFDSAQLLGMNIPYTSAQLENAVLETLKMNKQEEAYIRPIVYFGDVGYNLNLDRSQRMTSGSINVTIITTSFTYFDTQMRVHVSRWRRIPPQCVPVEAKLTGPYIASSLAATEAGKIYRVPEALQLDINGHVAEGPGENFFMVRGGKLVTPPRGHILPGITRDTVMQIARFRGIEVEEKNFTLDELLDTVEEAFFTGTAIEVYPIVQINQKKINNKEEGGLTRLIREDYSKLVRAQLELPGSENWIAFVPRTIFNL